MSGIPRERYFVKKVGGSCKRSARSDDANAGSLNFCTNGKPADYFGSFLTTRDMGNCVGSSKESPKVEKRSRNVENGSNNNITSASPVVEEETKSVIRCKQQPIHVHIDPF